MQTQFDTLADAVSEKFNFGIVKRQLARIDSGAATSMFGLFRADTGEEVRPFSCSEDYVPHQTEDVIALCEAASEVLGDVSGLRCYFNKGHFVELQPSQAERRRIFGERDNIFPRVVISAGYNGKSFRACMGMFRDACSNMAMMMKVHGTAVAIRHTHGLRDKMDDLIADFSGLLGGFDVLAGHAVSMQLARVNLREFISGCFGSLSPDATRRKKNTWENRFSMIRSRIDLERGATGRPAFDLYDNPTVSAWEAYNGVQGYIQHNSQMAKKCKSDFERALKAADHPAVKAAENLALAACE